MPKKGTEYELFVKAVYECLNRADGLSDVQIQHDVKLMGAAGVEHQIDVFWTFKLGGVDYKVAVECKDYNSHVSKEKIEAFHSILHDIGDSITSRGNFDEFFKNKQVLNRGIEGDTVEGVYNRLDEVMLHDPDCIFIMIGINDSNFPHHIPLQPEAE